MEVSELMHRAAVTCADTSPVRDVAQAMRDQNVGCVVLVNEHGRLAGIVTDRDVALRTTAPDQQALSIASREIAYVYAHDDVFSAATTMATVGYRRLPILDASGAVTGIITLDDLLVLFARQVDKLSRAVSKEIVPPAAA
jgi:CBS domain-containing protein